MIRCNFCSTYDLRRRSPERPAVRVCCSSNIREQGAAGYHRGRAAQVENYVFEDAAEADIFVNKIQIREVVRQVRKIT